jgi:tetratricopeptide (TPR) repeat protein
MRVPTLRSSLWFLLIFGPATHSPAQALPATPPPAATDNFAAEPFVILHRASMIAMQADGTGYREQTLAVRVQSDAALRQLGVVTVPFASKAEHVDFTYVRVRHPDGSVLATDTADALDEPLPVTREAPFYSDLKQKELPIRSLRLGDTIEWQVRITRTVAEAPNHFWGSETFAKDAVILAETLELRVPATTTVNVWTNSGMSAPTSTLVGAEHVYRWQRTQLNPTAGPAAEAAKKDKDAHLLTAAEELDATQGALPDVAWTTFPDWAAVGAWYRELALSRAAPDDTLRAKVTELTAGKTTDENKARALYTYVATQIRYIGVSFGVGRYQPHTAAEVLANQYGDCKDKHTLLAALLAAAGIASDPVLIGEGIRFNDAVPSPASFNHLITLAHIGGPDPAHAVWLDTTTEIAPWRVLVPTIRDHAALVIPATGPALVLKTPAMLPFPASSTFQVVGSLNEDLTSESHILATYRGDDELVLRALLHQVSPGQYPQFVQQLMAGLGFGGTVSEAEVHHADDTTQPLVLDFHYHRVKEKDWGVNRITINFQQIFLPAVDDKKPPVAALQLGSPHTDTSTVQLKLPPHWTSEIPDAIHEKTDFATCDVTYRLEGGTFFGERRIGVLTDKVPQAKWKAYKTWYDECGASGIPYLQLIRNTGGKAAAASTSSTPSNPEAAKLIVQANAAIKGADLDRGLTLLGQAKALNPEQRGLWGAYGYRAYQLGAPNEMIDDDLKEVTLHPESSWVYAPLAAQLLKSNRIPEAIIALRASIGADPTGGWAQAALVNALANTNDLPGAIAAGKEALQHVPATDAAYLGLELVLATAEITSGDLASAADLLSTVLPAATTPANINSAAYLLAETGQHLPEAEAAERSMLDKLYEQSRAFKLDDTGNVLGQTSALLAASWDTLGYIFFREGQLPEARNYISAAWHSGHVVEIGEHLGEIEVALHHPDAALDVYELALATVPPAPAQPAARATAAAARVQQAIAKLKQSGARSTPRDTRAALQHLRTFPLSAPPHTTGYGRYRILLAGDQVADLHATDHALPTAEDALRALHLPGFLPTGVDAKLALDGTINCTGPTNTCTFLLSN